MPDIPGVPDQPTPPEPPPFEPVATPQYQPVASAYQSPPPPPIAAQPAPAQSGGTSALKIILIIVAVFVCLGVLALGVVGYGVYRVSHAIHKGLADNRTITIPTAGGAFTASTGETFTADELGTDIYPGAEPSKTGSVKMHLPTGSMISATYLTSDSKDKVLDFYKQKFGSAATSMDFGSNAILTLKKSDHDQVTVTVSQRENQDSGKTQIHIQHVTSEAK